MLGEVGAADEAPVGEEGAYVVAVDAAADWLVCLEEVGEAEQPLHAGAVPKEVVERAEEEGRLRAGRGRWGVPRQGLSHRSTVAGTRVVVGRSRVPGAVEETDAGVARMRAGDYTGVVTVDDHSDLVPLDGAA